MTSLSSGPGWTPGATASDGQTLLEPWEIEGWADGLSQEFLDCRRYQHAWLALDFRELHNQRDWVEITQCQRCKTEKHRSILSGNVKYIYPEDYKAPEGTGHLTKEHRVHLTLAGIKRFPGGEVQAELIRKRIR